MISRNSVPDTSGFYITNQQRAGGFQPPSQTWSYDDAGNWNSTTKNGTTENRTHSLSDHNNLSRETQSFTRKGNLTEYEINSKQYEVTYDLDNRIIKVDVNNTDVEYRYDALGRRTIRKEGSSQTALLWWGNSECAEYVHGAGQSTIQNDIMSHPTRLNAVIARAVDGSKFDLEWYHKNYLDHVYAVSNDSGNLTEHYRYTAFGEATIYNGNGTIQSSTQINNTITWNTRRLDTVSNYYLYKYRHYDPALGRWPSRDPIEESGGVNLYAFVGNDPISQWDYLGNMVYGAGQYLPGGRTLDRIPSSSERDGIPVTTSWGGLHKNSHKLKFKCLINEGIADAIYSSLANFSRFNQPGFQHSVELDESDSTAEFSSGFPFDQLNFFIGHSEVEVIVSRFPGARRVESITSGSHFLKGEREWGVVITGGSDEYLEGYIYTKAEERYASPEFGIGSDTLDWFGMGFNSQVEELWTTYLTNVLAPFEAQKVLEVVGDVEFTQDNE